MRVAPYYGEVYYQSLPDDADCIYAPNVHLFSGVRNLVTTGLQCRKRQWVTLAFVCFGLYIYWLVCVPG